MNNEVFEQFKTQAKEAAPIGGRIKFVIDDQPIFIDGTGDGNIVEAADKEADCVIITSQEVLEKLQAGKLNPMMAVMGGKVKIKGDMGMAMKLQGLLS